MRVRMLSLLCIAALFAAVSIAGAQQRKQDSNPGLGPLVQLLQVKGILSDAEAASLKSADDPAQASQRLAQLLMKKGLINSEEFLSLARPHADGPPSEAPAPANIIASTDHAGALLPLLAPPPGIPVAPQEKVAVIAAVAPLRMLPLAGDSMFRRDALVPAIRIGNDVKIKPYGFLKASFISDSSSPGGNDFPLPGFLGDTGPGNSAETHFNARASRIGADLEWLDSSKSVTLTGRVEADFEGNFSRVSNRNVSSIRSNALQIRLAYVRLDKKFSDKTSAFALFGQDWTPFGSSTLPPILETTGLGLGWGILYERLPQFRFGIGHLLGGARQWKLEPEFAVALSAFGNVPADIGNQLAYGERQGADSNRPEIQARMVLQFQLDRAPGVVPAQLIVSGVHGRREAIVLAANIPTDFKSAFPTGASVASSRYGLTAEAQLPTRYFTLLLKGYNGEDLRFYFVNGLFSNFNDTFGLTGTAAATSIDGSSTVVFGLDNRGMPVVAPQRPVRTRGGFVDLAIPLSRICGTNPEGRHAGWTLNFLYAFDDALARDVRRIGAANRSRSDVAAGTLSYKFNKYFNVGFEESYYRTRAANKGGPLPLYRGIPSYQWHDLRHQLAVWTTF
jgi:hypothetical protein